LVNNLIIHYSSPEFKPADYGKLKVRIRQNNADLPGLKIKDEFQRAEHATGTKIADDAFWKLV